MRGLELFGFRLCPGTICSCTRLPWVFRRYQCVACDSSGSKAASCWPCCRAWSARTWSTTTRRSTAPTPRPTRPTTRRSRPTRRRWRPAATPSFANYSTYDKGINALTIDVQGSRRPVARRTASRSRWATRARRSRGPPRRRRRGFAVRSGPGAGGADRATWIWADGAIKNTWLQVTFNATGAVFYFGNTPGETGNAAGERVRLGRRRDRRAQHTAGRPASRASTTSTATALVDAADETIARNNRRLLSRRPADDRHAGAESRRSTSDSPTIGLASEVIHYRYTLAERRDAATLTGVDLQRRAASRVRRRRAATRPRRATATTCSKRARPGSTPARRRSRRRCSTRAPKSFARRPRRRDQTGSQLAVHRLDDRRRSRATCWASS